MRITIYGRESEIQNIIEDIFDVVGMINLINFDSNYLFSSEHKNHDRRFFYRGNKTI